MEKSSPKCPHCMYSNGVVKKLGGAFFKIVHEKHRAKNAEAYEEQFRLNMESALQTNPEMRSSWSVVASSDTSKSTLKNTEVCVIFSPNCIVS